MGNSKPPFCFVHIPKTGGVTFHNILIDQYPCEKRITFVSRPEAKHYFDLPEAQKLPYKLVKGHLWFDEKKFSPSNQTIFYTFLRKPVNRTISHYFFLFQNKKHWFYKEITANQYSLKQLYDLGKVVNLDNCMVRFISGNVSKPWDSMSNSDLDLAIHNLDKYFHHFGISEYYDESLLILAKQLGWKTPYYSRLNEGSMKSKEPFDADTLELITHFNRLDEKLYQHALNRFLPLLKDNEQLLEQQLELFRIANKNYSSLRARLYPYLGSIVFR
ncbi:MAG: sulfotransferase family 2 domain-containing protein [Chitinophagales bacterium]